MNAAGATSAENIGFGIAIDEALAILERFVQAVNEAKCGFVLIEEVFDV